jgi:hypothetical protein
MDTKEQEFVTKDFLRAELQTLRTELQAIRADILEQLIVSQRWNTTMILGIYAMIAIGYFIKK